MSDKLKVSIALTDWPENGLPKDGAVTVKSSYYWDRCEVTIGGKTAVVKIKDIVAAANRCCGIV